MSTVQEEFAPKAFARVCAPRASWASRPSGARVAGAATGCTGMMVELNHVPLEARRDSWSDGHRPTVPSSSGGGFPFCRLLYLLKMEAAKIILLISVRCAVGPGRALAFAVSFPLEIPAFRAL